MSASVEKARQLGKHVADLLSNNLFEESENAKQSLGDILAPFSFGTDFREEILEAYWDGYWGGKDPSIEGENNEPTGSTRSL